MTALSDSSDHGTRPRIVAPVCVADPRVPQTLAEILRAIATTDGEGVWRNPSYYANIANLPIARYRLGKALLRLDEAERAHRLQVLRLWATGETACAYCGHEFVKSLASVVASGGKLFHCECIGLHEREFSEWMRASNEITPAGREILAQPSDAA